MASAKLVKAEDYKQRRVLISIESSPSHCSGDCPMLGNDGEECNLFHRKLQWDRSKQAHGQFRLEECKEAEAQALAKNISPERGEGCTRVKCENMPNFTLRWESRGAQGPVYAYCCSNHLPEALKDYREDVASGGFKVECVN